MKSNHRRPLLPLLGVLVGLLALSLTAPRAWRRAASPPSTATCDADWMVEQAAEERRAAGEMVAMSDAVSDPVWGECDVESAVPVPTEPSQADKTEEVPAELALTAPRATVRVSSPDDRLAMAPRRSSPQQEVAKPAPRPRTQPPTVQPAPAARQSRWAMPVALLADLTALADNYRVGAWSASVRRTVEQLAGTSDDSEIEPLLVELQRQTAKLETFAQQMDDDYALQTRLLRTHYSLRKRLDVWQLVQQAMRLDAEPHKAVVGMDLEKPLGEVAALLHGSPESAAWREYLLIDALKASGSRTSGKEQRELAATVLARLSQARRTNARTFVVQPEIAALDNALRSWTAEPVEAVSLLAAIERFEQSGSRDAGRRIAEAAQSLAWAESQPERQLAEQLRRHYRNANLRVAIHADLLNRILPTPDVAEAPVYDNILGARVAGTSRTSTQLAVRLAPDSARLRMQLEATGLVDSYTRASKGPVRFYSAGETVFTAVTPITVGSNGLHAGSPDVSVSTDNNLVDMETNVDRVPVVGAIVRGIAKSQHDRSQDEALAIASAKARSEIASRMEAEMEPQLAALEDRFRRQVWDRLARLGLEPTPLELRTTPERMIMRVRLADRDQLGGHTPRPRAMSDSLLSVQLHESVAANLIDQLELDGQTLTPVELYQRVAARLELPGEVPDDLPDDARITFASRDAVQIRLAEGRVEFHLAVEHIEQPRRQIRNFRVIVAYVPQVEGLRVEMHRDPTIQLIGAQRLGFGTQIALRGVFAKIFSKKRPLVIDVQQMLASRNITGLRNAAISELALERGWLGLSVSPAVQRTAQSGSPPRR